MGDLVSDQTGFSCPFCTSKLKLCVPSSSVEADSKKLANTGNHFFPPPPGQCTLIPSAPVPCTPSTNVVNPGQSTFDIDGKPNLGAGCQLMCAKGGLVTVSSSGQSVAKHDGATGAEGAENPPLKKTSDEADDEAIEEYFVYEARDESTKEVTYVGITNDMRRRGQEHQEANRFGPPKQLYKAKSKEEARCVEQALIEIHGRKATRTGKPLEGKLLNKINSISPKKTNYEARVKRGADILKEMNYPGVEKLSWP